jgi:hypothetical protein
MHQFAMSHTCRAARPRIEYRLGFQASALEDGHVLPSTRVAALVDEWSQTEEAVSATTMNEKVWSLWAFLARVMRDDGRRVLVTHVSAEVFGEVYAFEP